MPDPVLPVIVIGGGPAGLMAAEEAALAGAKVEVFDAMPSAGRKFLLAGKGGLNLTHSEPFTAFVERYGDRAPRIRPHLAAFGPEALRAWAKALGIDTFVGSSGRVFPADFKAAPLLRAWLRRLKTAGVRFHLRHRWLGWDADGQLRFAAPDGEIRRQGAATVLALGGGSWPHLGSDGAWTAPVAARGIAIAPLRPSNCGFDVGWSDHFRERFAGAPIKLVTLRFAGRTSRGEVTLTETGIEGGPVYALSASLRDAIDRDGAAILELDLKPDWSAEKARQALARPQGSRSWSSHLSRCTGLTGAGAALLREILGRDPPACPERLATAIKALPLRLRAPRPLAEAISSAGGIGFESLGPDLMLSALPGVFAAGEMLDWEAPTGGYLLTACFATGRAAGAAAAAWAQKGDPSRRRKGSSSRGEESKKPPRE
ncbi:MAG: TIGR03862 family flavoprotein [Magnetospirillum sp.]|nr:TIGR03862 family flavoprotein [Magnetospirillum sp.]